MKQRFSLSKETMKHTALYTLILLFAAHAFCFFNLSYSGDAVILNVSKARSAQIASGQFLAPYYFRLRGAISAPLYVGMLSALYLTVISVLCAWLLRLEKKAHLFMLCGTLTASAAMTALFAGSLHTADASLLAMLFAVLAVASCLRFRFGFLAGGAFLAAAMALDPSSLAFFAALFVIAAISDLLFTGERPQFIRAFVKLIPCAAIGVVGWMLASAFLAKRNDVTLTCALQLPEGGVIGAWLAPFRALLAPLTAYPAVNILLHALFLLSALALIFFCLGKQPASLGMLIFGLFLLPLAASLPLFYMEKAAQITPAYCLIDSLLVVLLARLAPSSSKARLLATAAFGTLFLGSIVFSNQVYLKKNLEFESTLAFSSRIVHRAEQTLGYKPGFTPVAVIGTPEDSIFSMQRKGFEHLSALEAASSNYAVTSDEEMIWYFWEVLGYPFNFVSTFELSQIAQKDAVVSMPAFPAEGCCAMVDDVLVIRIN